jgi:inosine-uridine nucleoside N-ribohydrolase
MIDLIYDCDITVGLPGRDVDDGLALLHLLGSREIRLLGVTSTFGNSSIDEVHPCLLSVLQKLGRSDIPAYRGAPREAIGEPPAQPATGKSTDARADSDAARYLAETVEGNPRKVSVLATGSPTNLLGAFRRHPGFFHDVQRIVLMGGIIEPLVINGREMAELNFASDPEAALYALYAGRPGFAGTPRPPLSDPEKTRCDITVISGNLCLQALLERERFDAFIRECRETGAETLAHFLEEEVGPWFSWIEQVYGLSGFHAWDATAALYLTDRQLFRSRMAVLCSTREDLSRGILRFEGDTEETPPDDSADTGAGSSIDIPSRIRDLPSYWRSLFRAWREAEPIGPA